MLPPAVLSLPVDELTLRRAAWRLGLTDPGRATRTTADLLVTRVGGLALKYPLSTESSRALAREERIIARLAADDRLPAHWRSLMPVSLPRGRQERAVLQQWLPGAPAADRPAGQSAVAARSALVTITELHRATGRQRPVGPLLDSWLRPPLEVLRGQLGAAAALGLDTVEDRLRGVLAGREVLAAWTHGDYHPGNVLLTGSPSAPRVTGVIDWVQACSDGPAAIDGCLYLLARRRETEQREIGDCVVAAIRSGGLPEADLRLLASTGVDAAAYGPDGIGLPLLTWLWHAAGNLAKSARFARSHRWVAKNVHPVLAALSSTA
jgi:aminoglycoside phosphotransferase (APT) family kinase protein